MTRSHSELREALGAFVLGQLDDEERRDVEQHLATCADCRLELDEISPLVAALRTVDPDDVHPVGIVPPAELDARIRSALPAAPHGLRRWAPLTGAVLAAAAAAAVVTTIVVSDEPAGPTVIAVPRVTSAQGVTASAGLVNHTWGLEIKLKTAGLPAGERFEMWIVGRDGIPREAGGFLGVTPGVTITCDMSSSILLRDAASFRVLDAAGTEVISAALPS